MQLFFIKQTMSFDVFLNLTSNKVDNLVDCLIVKFIFKQTKKT